MARLVRICPPGIPQHIIQRGNNRQLCFAANADFAAYAHWLHEACRKFSVDIHAWVFMTNHVHLLATPQQEGGISHMMQWVGRHYVRYFNRTYQRSGTLWEGRFKSCVVDAENYLLVCQRYIELNPVRAHIVNDPANYRWSSYRSNALGRTSKLWKPHEVYLRLGPSERERLASYRALFTGRMDDSLLGDIRESANRGLALGPAIFKDQMAALTGRRVTPRKRGPKKRDGESYIETQEFLLWPQISPLFHIGHKEYNKPVSRWAFNGGGGLGKVISFFLCFCCPINGARLRLPDEELVVEWMP